MSVNGSIGLLVHFLVSPIMLEILIYPIYQFLVLEQLYITSFSFPISALLIDEDLTVKPGTPLQMSIELDRLSSDIYGVMVSNMEGRNSTLILQANFLVNISVWKKKLNIFLGGKDNKVSKLNLPIPGHRHQGARGDPHSQWVSL